MDSDMATDEASESVASEAVEIDTVDIQAVEINTVETDLAIIGGSPDDEDMAALTAVLGEVLDELAAEQGRLEHALPSAWSRSQRPIRLPLTSGVGAWRSFNG
jgi:hypothetical protein